MILHFEKSKLMYIKIQLNILREMCSTLWYVGVFSLKVIT